MSEDTQRRGQLAQTLDRGLHALEVVAAAAEGMTVTEVAAAIGVHRSITTRLLATLLSRGYVNRRSNGRYVVGTTLLTVARSVSHDLLAAAVPLMTEVSDRLGLTVMMHIADGGEAVTLASIEPRNGAIRVGVRPGARHPLSAGASGLAILAGREPEPGERKEVTTGRARGYVVTMGEVVPNFVGVDAPIRIGNSVDVSVGLIVLADGLYDEKALGREVIALATRIAAATY